MTPRARTVHVGLLVGGLSIGGLALHAHYQAERLDAIIERTTAILARIEESNYEMKLELLTQFNESAMLESEYRGTEEPR